MVQKPPTVTSQPAGSATITVGDSGGICELNDGGLR